MRAVRMAAVGCQVQIVVFMVIEIAQEVLCVRLVTLKNVGAWPCVPSIRHVRLMVLPYHRTRASVFDVRWGGCRHHMSSMGLRYILLRSPAKENSIFVVHEIMPWALHPLTLMMP